MRLAFSNELPQGEGIPAQNALAEWQAVMQRILETLYRRPILLNLPLEADQAFSCGQYHSQNPSLSKCFYKAQKIISGFYRCLMQIGFDGTETETHNLVIEKATLKDSKLAWKSAYQILLELAGISCVDKGDVLEFSCPSCPAALQGWMYLSRRAEAQTAIYPKSGSFCFATCNYTGHYDEWLSRAEQLAGLQPGYFDKITGLCLDRGARIEAYGILGNNEVSFYYRMARNVGGFAIEYHAYDERMICFANVNGLGIKAMLTDFEQLPPDVCEYLMQACHECDDCGACTKGGKVASFAAEVMDEGKVRRLCPLFTQREWSRLDLSWVRKMLAFGDMQEQYGAGSIGHIQEG